MRWVLLGAPGSGKGTQAERIVKDFKLPHIATGDIFREAIAKETDLGIKAKEYIDRGQLVPDDIVVGIVNEKLSSILEGFLLDGYPRTIVQAEELDKFLLKNKKPLTGVLLISVSQRTILDRLTNRFICEKCGINKDPSDTGDKCKKCGGNFVKRADDNVETVKKRITVYLNQTTPLIEYYKKKKVLYEVNGEGTPFEIYNEIKATLFRLKSEFTM
ncbi:MAG: adenylate kinase [Candidatus Hydrogenedentota bacterium]